MPSPLPPGIILQGRYRIVGQVGHGSYLTEDLTRFNEPCVLQELIPMRQEPGLLSELQQSVQQETALLYALEHPQIPRFRGVVAYDQRLLLVQEYVDGKSYRALLDERLTQGIAFTEAEVRQLLWQFLPVLLHVHSRGLIHGNIAPENIWWRQRDRLPVLTHFGLIPELALELRLRYGGLAWTVERLGYAPIEQSKLDKLYRNSDLYSLAATAVVLLTGQPPHVLYQPRRKIWNWEPWVAVSPEFAQILNRMLSARPQDRYASVGKVLRSLRDLANRPVTPAVLPPAASALAIAPQHRHTLPVVVTPPTPEELAESEVLAPEPEATPPRWNRLVLATVVIWSLVLVSCGAWAAWAVVQQVQTVRQQQPGSTTATSPGGTETASDSARSPAQAEMVPAKNEPAIQDALRDRRRELNVSYDVFIALVDTLFYAQHPDLNNRRLGSGTKDQGLRRQWNATAEDVLNKLELLSPDVRSAIGQYREWDYNRWAIDLERFHLSRPTFAQLVDARFYRLFPDLRDRYLDPDTLGQVWLAIADQQLQAIRSGQIVEPLALAPEAPSVTIQGNLKPGEGKAYVVNINAGQPLKLRLEAPKAAARLSIYAPNSTNTSQALLNQSPVGNWSGLLSQPGYYQIVVVADSPELMRYRLTLSR